MLLSATVRGIPELSRLANCCVNVASSWSFGLRFWAIAARSVGGSKARQSVLAPSRPLDGGRDRPALGRVHRDREEPQALNLDQGRRTIGDLKHALDHFTGSASGLVRKLRHRPRLFYSLTTNLAKSCAIPSGNFASGLGGTRAQHKHSQY